MLSERAAGSATPRPRTSSANCVTCGDQSRYWLRESALRVQPGAHCRFHRAQPGPGEGATRPFPRSRGRFAPRAAVATEEPGKSNAVTPRFIAGLADILVEQGRMRKPNIGRVSLEISQTVALPGSVSRSSSSRSSAISCTCNARDGKGSRSMRRSTRRSQIGSRGGGRRSNSTAAAFTRSMLRDRSRPESRGRTDCEAAVSGRREQFQYRLGARHAGDRPDAGGTRPGCDPRIQGRDTGPDGILARERRR